VRIGARRERRDLLVANVNPLNRSFTTDRVDDPVERISDDSVDPFDTGLDQSLNHLFCNCSHNLRLSIALPGSLVFGPPSSFDGVGQDSVVQRSVTAFKYFEQVFVRWQQ
jgi:hypothetical protein